MTVEQWLKRVQFIEAELKTLDEMYQEELDKVTSITPKLSGMSSSGTKDPHKYDTFAQISAEIDNQRNKLLTAKAEIVEVISSVQDERYRTVLYQRLIMNRQWSRIASELYYSETQTRRLYRSGIKAAVPFVEEMMDNNGQRECDILIS